MSADICLSAQLEASKFGGSKASTHAFDSTDDVRHKTMMQAKLNVQMEQVTNLANIFDVLTFCVA